MIWSNTDCCFAGVRGTRRRPITTGASRGDLRRPGNIAGPNGASGSSAGCVFRSRWPKERRGFTQRSGMTLLEVLIALSIFMVAMAAISQLISTGSRASVEARLEAEAALRAETVLNEVLSGVHLMQSSQQNPFSDDPDWKWSLTVSEGPHVDLHHLEVTVVRQPAGVAAPQVVSTLHRLTRNPELFLDASLSQ